MSHETLNGIAPQPLVISDPIRSSRVFALTSGVRRVVNSIDLGAVGTNDSLAFTNIWTVWVISTAGTQVYHAVSHLGITRFGASVVTDVTNLNPTTTIKAVSSGTITVTWDAAINGTVVEIGITATSSLTSPQIRLASIPFVPIPIFGTVVPS